MTFFEKVYNTGIVPVVVLNKAEDAVPLARALLKGGIDFMEITFRTECAAESIALIAKEVPEMTVGAGTVISVEQAALAVKNGAKFIVSPGLDDGVVIWAKGNNIPVIPGCVTPTEIMKAISLMIPQARDAAIRILNDDPKLIKPENRMLREHYKELFAQTFDWSQIG